MTPSEGAAWFFDAGAESLDFAYTGALADERLHSPEDLAGWLAEHLAHPAPEVGERDLADALILREALARLHLAAADHTPFAPDDIDTLNLFAATPDIPPALAGGRRQAGAGRIRGREPRRARRGPHPPLRRRRLPAGVPRRVAHQQPPLVLDATLRQPRQGARASRARARGTQLTGATAAGSIRRSSRAPALLGA